MSDALHRLCLACGLCCDGSLFEVVALDGLEVRRLAERGVRLEQRRGATLLAFPCTALKGTCCQMYDERPKGCRAFECFVLRRLAGGGVSEAEALALVEQARAHLSAVARLFDVPAGVPVLGHARRAVGDPGLKVSMEAAQSLRTAEAFIREHLLGT